MRKLYDLSQPFFSGMPHAPNIGPFTATYAATHDDSKDGRLQVMEYRFASHTGTHLDAPRHVVDGGKTIDQIPLERLKRRCVLVHCPKEPFGEITIADVEANGVEIHPGDFVFFDTGFGPKFLEESYVNNASITEDLAWYLVEKGASIVGVDSNTIELTYCLRPEGFNFPIHHILLEREILVIEHLNLSHVPEKELEVSVFALNILGADGSPVRVVGETYE